VRSTPSRSRPVAKWEKLHQNSGLVRTSRFISGIEIVFANHIQCLLVPCSVRDCHLSLEPFHELIKFEVQLLGQSPDIFHILVAISSEFRKYQIIGVKRSQREFFQSERESCQTAVVVLRIINSELLARSPGVTVTAIRLTQSSRQGKRRS
jgi:hypothetical protein